ncbi:hypothetical protein VTK26DRAFT_7203 [Humicola hyalothermophila]
MIPGRLPFRPPARIFPSRRHLPNLRQTACIRRWESNTGHAHTGHIDTKPNESILFFDNLFPLKVSSVLLWRPWGSNRDLPELLKKLDNAPLGLLSPIALVRQAIPESVPIKITEIIPRLKEGGAYVKFAYPTGRSAAEVEGELVKSLSEKPVKPWFNPFRGVKACLVLGRPWLEDLYRLPKSRLKVEFVAASDSRPPTELSQECLYGLFRRYGKIVDIGSQPSDSKIVPKYAYVDFALVRDAIMARNCMHGFVLQEEENSGPTRLRLSYEQRVKPHNIWDWITRHPRIVIPIIAAALAAFTVAVFDPIREFFVKSHVQKSFEFTDSRFYKWLKRQTSDILPFHQRSDEDAGLNALFTHRKDLIDTIQSGLMESADTFIVVHGPRGSGGRELILNRVLHGRRNVLVLDCKQVVEARGEARTIGKLANQVGYRPVFSWANNLSSMVDLAIQSTTGVKAGFSETLESQISKILQTTASALKRASLGDRKKDDKDANLSDDAYLEAHPERRPVVVIDNFLYKGDGKGIIYDKIADWAAALVQSNVAHVIFLTTDMSFSKPLSRSLPDRVFHQVRMSDLPPDAAKQYVISQLEQREDAADRTENDGTSPILTGTQRRDDLAELDECIDALGGRVTNLQVLARRLQAGQSPKKAVSDMIEQSAAEILRMFLLTKGSGGDGSSNRKYSTEQAWYLIRELAAHDSLRYNEVLLSPTFASSATAGAGSPEAAIESLADAELVTVRSRHGRPAEICPGKPVYRAAFARLTEDAVVKARMDLALLGELARIEARAIEKAEAELAVLARLPGQPRQAGERVGYLLGRVQESQRRIEELEGEMARCKRVLREQI